MGAGHLLRADPGPKIEKIKFFGKSAVFNQKSNFGLVLGPGSVIFELGDPISCRTNRSKLIFIDFSIKIWNFMNFDFKIVFLLFLAQKVAKPLLQWPAPWKISMKIFLIGSESTWEWKKNLGGIQFFITLWSIMFLGDICS